VNEVEILVPSGLRAATGGRDSVPADGGDVGTTLRTFAASDPRIQSYLYHADGTMRRSFAVCLNDVDVRNLQGEATPVRKGDRLSIVPSLSGG
jgi:molybdopterin converting factor small subunit